MRVLILGAGGQVGRAITRAMAGRHDVIEKTRAELDIGDAGAVARGLADARPEWIINAAAYTAVDLAEDNPDSAWAINDKAVGVLAEAACRHRTRLVHLSTDFVFDGNSNRAYTHLDAPRPLSVYGESKLAGERRALEAACEAVVVRTAWVYAAAGRNFVLTMLRLMGEREQVRVVCDQIGAPTWAAGLADALRDLIESRPAKGIYHWTDLGVASWYDFAVAIQDEALERGLLRRRAAIVPIASGDYPTRARRPAFSVLDSTATRALLTTPAAHWRHNLRMMLDELRAA